MPHRWVVLLAWANILSAPLRRDACALPNTSFHPSRSFGIPKSTPMTMPSLSSKRCVDLRRP